MHSCQLQQQHQECICSVDATGKTVAKGGQHRGAHPLHNGSGIIACGLLQCAARIMSHVHVTGQRMQHGVKQTCESFEGESGKISEALMLSRTSCLHCLTWKSRRVT